ncbi:hypothetical protein FE840_001875 [Peteryoungia desertarenae]|uniref:Uncharacterized protein n=1 Tax=Peteryoungia desertarenae TaxID=1813451 RepID=A0ABX6QJW3_9HYPH|nr:hypothetical protein [Peteryoungia desertarenae]QLF68395.1 hypothetical protein FE840_001875 [Peteryoungia desertarenae]
MAKDALMPKHQGFPLGLPGTQWQYTIRRANPKVTPVTNWPRHRTMDQTVALADLGFMQALWQYFGTEPFERGNLDGERLCRLFGREVIAAERGFDPQSYFAKLKINEPLARKNFPEAFGEATSEQSVGKGLKKKVKE